MIDYTLRQLQYFRVVAECGSIAAAANSLFLSHSALSSAMNDLERHFGVPLFVRRRSQGVSLTPDGAHLLTLSRDLLGRASDLDAQMSGEGQVLRGAVSVGCYTTLAATVLPVILDDFATAFPDVSVRYSDGSLDELIATHLKGELDVFVTYRHSIPSTFSEVVLYELQPYVLLPAGHHLADESLIELDRLAHEPLVLFDVAPSGRHTLDVLERAGVLPHVAFRTSNFELVRSLVGRGLGYSILMQSPAADVSYEGTRVVARPLTQSSPVTSVVMAWRAEQGLTDRATALVEHLRSTFARSAQVAD